MNVDTIAKVRGRLTFNVDGVSGDYANERLTLGVPDHGGTRESSFRSVTALWEGPVVSGAVVELWLSSVPDAGTGPISGFTDANFFNSGLTTLSAPGAVTWTLSGWPAVQIRVKSGAFPGAPVISASAF